MLFSRTSQSLRGHSRRRSVKPTPRMLLWLWNFPPHHGARAIPVINCRTGRSKSHIPVAQMCCWNQARARLKFIGIRVLHMPSLVTLFAMRKLISSILSLAQVGEAFHFHRFNRSKNVSYLCASVMTFRPVYAVPIIIIIIINSPVKMCNIQEEWAFI